MSLALGNFVHSVGENMPAPQCRPAQSKISRAAIKSQKSLVSSVFMSAGLKLSRDAVLARNCTLSQGRLSKGSESTLAEKSPANYRAARVTFTEACSFGAAPSKFIRRITPPNESARDAGIFARHSSTPLSRLGAVLRSLFPSLSLSFPSWPDVLAFVALLLVPRAERLNKTRGPANYVVAARSLPLINFLEVFRARS